MTQVKVDSNNLKEDFTEREFRPEFVKRAIEIKKQKGIKFDSTEELDKLVKNAQE